VRTVPAVKSKAALAAGRAAASRRRAATAAWVLASAASPFAVGTKMKVVEEPVHLSPLS